MTIDKPNGRFAFDVPGLRAYAERTAKNAPNWYAAGPGFYRPHPHFVLEKPVPFPDIPALCDVISVLDSEMKTYRFWQTFYSPDTIREEVERCGFRVIDVLSDLTGKGYTEETEAMGVVCKKM
ncbi:MAG: hypothetical protein ABIG45_00095 [Bacillota bacterium]